MIRMSLTVNVACLVAALSGCQSRSNLQVRIDPKDVAIQFVKINEQNAVRLEPGLYGGRIEYPKESETEVRVEARSNGGISSTKTVVRSKADGSEVVLNFPASVKVQVVGAEAKDTVVKIDGQPVEAKGQSYDLELPMPQPRAIEVFASTKNGRLTDLRKVQARAGETAILQLTLSLTANIDAKQSAIAYGEKIDFDASKSTPSSVRKFIWNFGDGSEEKTTEIPRAEHVYRYDSSRPKVEEFTVAVKACIGTEESKPASLVLRVLPPSDELALSWDVFPHTATIQPDEKFQLVLSAQRTETAIRPINVLLSFDEGKSFAQTPDAIPLTLQCANGHCNPIVFRHAFPAAGHYTPKITYVRPETGIIDPKPATLRSSQTEIVVAPPFLSKEELVELAWEDVYRKFDQLLHEANVSQKWLALTSLDCANFETGQPEFVPVVDRLTKMLVEDPDQYNILEKKSQVLARLAPEAVINVRPEWETTGPGSADALDEQPYRQHLEYGLAAEHGGPQQPIVYSVKIAGTNDTMQEADSRSFEQGGSGKRKTEQLPVPLMSFEQSDSNLATWLRNLPILMARFKTADILVAIKLLEDPHIEEIEGWLFDEELGESMVRRTATVRLHVRLVERIGRIVKAIDLDGQSEQLVPQSEFVVRNRDLRRVQESQNRVSKSD